MYYHASPRLVAPTSIGAGRSPRHILSVSAGWEHTAALTSTGDILVWYPFSEEYAQECTPEGELTSTNPDKKGRIVKYGKVGNVVQGLDVLPSRPDEPQVSGVWDEYDADTSAKEKKDDEKVVKIASGEHFVLALKANGEVWIHATKVNEFKSWVYVSLHRVVMSIHGH